MMDVVIHGTKSGYRILYSSSERLISIKVNDPANDQPKIDALGSISYSVAFFNKELRISKTLIVLENERTSRTGNLNFSLIFTEDMCLSGSDCKLLLDELCDFYINNFMLPNFTLDTNKAVDWNFVQIKLDEFRSRLRSNTTINKISAHPKVIAYCYYNNDIELSKYLEAPYQHPFLAYQQVFFIDSLKRGKSDDPLGVLKHSENADLTGKIHFEKVTIEYILKNYNSINDGGVKIQFFKNNVLAREGDRFVESDLVKVIYSKKNHEDLVISGKLKGSEVTKYLTFNQVNNSFIINRDVKMLAKYPVHPGKNGSFNISGQLFSKTSDGQDVKHFISADEGYKFIGFENINGVLTAQYKKQANFIPLIWVGLGAALCSLIFALVYFLWPSDKNDTYKYRAIEYINGAEWNADTLNSLSKLCCLGADYDTGLCNKVSKAVEFRSFLDSGKLTTIKSGKSGFENAFEDAQSKVRSLLTLIVTIKDDDLKEKIGKELREHKSVRTDLGSISGFIGDMKKLFTIEAAIDSLTRNDSLALKAKRKELEDLKKDYDFKKRLLGDIDKKLKGEKVGPKKSPVPQGNGKGSAAGEGKKTNCNGDDLKKYNEQALAVFRQPTIDEGTLKRIKQECPKSIAAALLNKLNPPIPHQRRQRTTINNGNVNIPKS